VLRSAGFCLLFIWVSLASVGGAAPQASDQLTTPPLKVIYFIGDGMGPEQIKAARLYAGEALSFEDFPYQGVCGPTRPTSP
jgi:alkaline phosphatase